MFLKTKSYYPYQQVRIVDILFETNIFENHEYMCFEIFVYLIMIWTCLRNRKYDELWFEIYLYLIFLYSKIL